MTVNGHDERPIDAMNIDMQHATVDIDLGAHVSVRLHAAPDPPPDGPLRRPPHRGPPPSLPATPPPGAPPPWPQRFRLPLQLRRKTCRSGRTTLRRDTTCGIRRRRIRAA